MPYWTEMTAVCPQCGVSATGRREIEEVFGFRYGGTKPQSWCKSCRSSANSSSSYCAYNLCERQDEFPRCRDEGRCPLEDD